MEDLPNFTSLTEEAERLRYSLVAGMPDDLGRMVRRMVGIGSTGQDNLPGSQPANPIAWVVPALTQCCQAYGQPAQMAVPVGVCFELLGIVSAVLDTAEDAHQGQLQAYCADVPHREGSLDKRLKMALVMNAGVALTGLAWQALLVYGPQYGLPPPKILAISELLTCRWATICDAQHRDLTVGRALDLSLDAYEQIVAEKAGEIGGTACEAGAILAEVEAYRPLWRTLGMERTIVQQLADDAKDLDQDLAEGQQLGQAVRYGLAVAEPPQKQRLLELLGYAQGAAALEARRQLVQALEELGAVQYVLVSLAIHRQRALDALQTLALPETTQTWFQRWIVAAADVALPPSNGTYILGSPSDKAHRLWQATSNPTDDP